MKNKKSYIAIAVIILTICTLSVNSTTAMTQQRPKIKIGTLGPMAITPGIDLNQGVELAVKEINDGDGVMIGATAYDIELVKETTSGTMGFPDTSTGLFSLTKLQDEDEVIAIIGGFRTEVVINLQFQLDRPMLGCGHTAPLFTPYMWRVTPGNATGLFLAMVDLYSFALAPYAGIQNVTIFREEADWTLRMSNNLKKFCHLLLPNGFIYSPDYPDPPYPGHVGPSPFPDTPLIHFTDDIVVSTQATYDAVKAAVAPLKAATFKDSSASPYNTLGADLKVNAIASIFSGPVGRHATKAWAEQNLPQMMVGVNVESQASDYFDQTEGQCYGEIVMETAPPDVNPTGTTAAFRTAYSAAHPEGKDPTYTSFGGYESVYILKQAFERIGTTPEPTTAYFASLQAALELTDYLGPRARIRFTSEPGPQLGMNSTGDEIVIPGTDVHCAALGGIVHDTFTRSTIGSRNLTEPGVKWGQWQEGGKKVTIWGNASYPCFVAGVPRGTPGFDDLNGTTSAKMLNWTTFDHANHGWTPEPEPTETEPTMTKTKTKTKTAEVETTTVRVPGFVLPLVFLVMAGLALLVKRNRQMKRFRR